MWIIANSIINTVSSLKELICVTRLFCREFISGNIKNYIHERIKNYVIKKYELGLVKPVNIKMGPKIGQFYDIHYHFGSTKYIARTAKKRGLVENIDSAVGKKYENDQDEDITDMIKMYHGPSKDFHGIKTSPHMLGYEYIKIEYSTGTALYTRDEHM